MTIREAQRIVYAVASGVKNRKPEKVIGSVFKPMK